MEDIKHDDVDETLYELDNLKLKLMLDLIDAKIYNGRLLRCDLDDFHNDWMELNIRTRSENAGCMSSAQVKQRQELLCKSRESSERKQIIRTWWQRLLNLKD